MYSSAVLMTVPSGDVTKAYLLGFGITVGCSIPGLWMRMI
jgi:hypothetical protein